MSGVLWKEGARSQDHEPGFVPELQVGKAKRLPTFCGAIHTSWREKFQKPEGACGFSGLRMAFGLTALQHHQFLSDSKSLRILRCV
jgi:hypothetical protein